jgi:hypothetical protein
LLAVPVPTDRLMPVKVLLKAEVLIQAEPPQEAELPPIKLPDTVKSVPEELVIWIILYVTPAPGVNEAVSKKLFPEIVQEVVYEERNMPFETVAAFRKL